MTVDRLGAVEERAAVVGIVAGGVPFGPITSANITPDADGNPAGLSADEFVELIARVTIPMARPDQCSRSSERVVDLERRDDICPQALTIERNERVRRHYRVVGEPPADADRDIEDVAALDLKEERIGNRLGQGGWQ